MRGRSDKGHRVHTVAAGASAVPLDMIASDKLAAQPLARTALPR